MITTLLNLNDFYTLWFTSLFFDLDFQLHKLSIRIQNSLYLNQHTQESSILKQYFFIPICIKLILEKITWTSIKGNVIHPGGYRGDEKRQKCNECLQHCKHWPQLHGGQQLGQAGSVDDTLNSTQNISQWREVGTPRAANTSQSEHTKCKMHSVFPTCYMMQA